MSDYKLKKLKNQMEEQRKKVVENNQGSISDFLFDKLTGGTKPYDINEDKMNQIGENIIEKSKNLRYKKLKNMIRGDK